MALAFTSTRLGAHMVCKHAFRTTNYKFSSFAKKSCSGVNSNYNRVFFGNSRKNVRIAAPAALSNHIVRFLHDRHSVGSSVGARTTDPGEHSASSLRQHFKERRLLGWSRQQLYDLVADIDNYKVHTSMFIHV